MHITLVAFYSTYFLKLKLTIKKKIEFKSHQYLVKLIKIYLLSL